LPDEWQQAAGESRRQAASQATEIKDAGEGRRTDRRAKPEEDEPTKVGTPEKLAEPGDETEGESQEVSHW